ncbi:hypothetical protein ALP54_03579 [Pseudomonas amygdali pv. lachrymans]|nr:hypothetical protein ALP54_03579 [Pseudomonas amygdali pv. lachrymans]
MPERKVLTPEQKQMMWDIVDARDLLRSGVRENRPDKVEDALSALKAVRVQAVEGDSPDIAQEVVREINHTLSDLAVVKHVMSGRLSGEVLELFMAHTDVAYYQLNDLNPQKMGVRLSRAIADSMIRHYEHGYYDYTKILSFFENKKHHGDWKRLYAHMLNATADISDEKYCCDHLHGEHNLFRVADQNENSPLTSSLLEVMLENQDAVLKHLKQLARFTDHYLSRRPLPSSIVCKLHARGFTAVVEHAGAELFSMVKDPRQLMIAQESGITIEKDFVVRKLLAQAYKPDNVSYQRMASDAIVYMLESDEFTMDDIKGIRASVCGTNNKANRDIKHMLNTDVAEALHGLYGREREKTSELTISKTRFMVTWALRYEPNGLTNELMNALMGLKHLPKTIIHKNLKLRDAAFAADLGL